MRSPSASAKASNAAPRKGGAAKRPSNGIRRKLRRLYRKHTRAVRAVNYAVASLCILAVLGALIGGGIALFRKPAPRLAPEVEVAAPPLDDMVRPTPPGRASVQPTATPTPEPTPEPTPDPRLYLQSSGSVADYANPSSNSLLTGMKVLEDESAKSLFVTDDADIHMGSSADYSALEGVTTFRGSNYRDGGAYGAIPENPVQMNVVWQKHIRKLDDWSGVGWTGQGSLVRWPDALRRQMNIVSGKRSKDGLVEVIYATLDGHIYFLDMEDGEKTRDPIDIGAPIKGSLTVDPRGLPLLYCGQGIYDVNGKRVPCGTRIWSLIDQKLLYFLDGKDGAALRAWAAFDCSPLVDGETDTMITAGENGVLYKVKLNTRELSDGIEIDPSVTRYVYQYQKGVAGKLGTENSVAIYNNYVYFATNAGIIQCVDLNTMELVWCVDALDDIDASMVIEPEEDGLVALYVGNELDRRGHKGKSQMFKLNALTGELLWNRDSDPLYQNDDNGGGSFATPAVGKNDLSGLVFFHVCRTREGNGTLYALDKRTGDTVWSKSLGSHGWSSPTCVYTASGKGYVLVGSASGTLRLLDGLTGDEAAQVKLRGNIEGTPAVFDDMIVVGTRSCLIYGIKIESALEDASHGGSNGTDVAV